MRLPHIIGEDLVKIVEADPLVQADEQAREAVIDAYRLNVAPQLHLENLDLNRSPRTPPRGSGGRSWFRSPVNSPVPMHSPVPVQVDTPPQLKPPVAPLQSPIAPPPEAQTIQAAQSPPPSDQTAKKPPAERVVQLRQVDRADDTKSKPGRVHGWLQFVHRWRWPLGVVAALLVLMSQRRARKLMLLGWGWMTASDSAPCIEPDGANNLVIDPDASIDMACDTSNDLIAPKPVPTWAKPAAVMAPSGEVCDASVAGPSEEVCDTTGGAGASSSQTAEEFSDYSMLFPDNEE